MSGFVRRVSGFVSGFALCLKTAAGIAFFNVRNLSGFCPGMSGACPEMSGFVSGFVRRVSGFARPPFQKSNACGCFIEVAGRDLYKTAVGIAFLPRPDSARRVSGFVRRASGFARVRVRACPARVRACPARVRICPARVRVCPARVRVCPARVRKPPLPSPLRSLLNPRSSSLAGQ